MYTFIVSSAIETTRGIFSPKERLLQTLETYGSIKRLVPNAEIITFDAGPSLSDKNQEILNRYGTLVCLQRNRNIVELANYKLLGHAEAVATHTLLSSFRDLIPSDTKRIFKLSGRYKLQDSFDINAYHDVGDKFVFAKRKKTWLSEEKQKELNIDALFNTRLYSFTPNLIDYYKSCLEKAYLDLGLGLDYEHVIYKNIDKNLVIEFDKVHVEGRIAPNGSIETD